MGLPLFVAPVESDIPSKPAAKSPAEPAHARSPIRRSDWRRQLHEVREHRLRMLAALEGDAPVPASSATASRLWDDLRRDASRPTSLSEDPSDRSSSRPRDSWAAFSDYLRDLPPSLMITSRSPGPQRPSILPSNESTPRSDVPTYARSARAVRHNAEASRLQAEASRRHARRQRSLGHARRGTRVRYVDGLGDRDRSLSPEGDDVWDILQSTLTPDPQPPSAGTSFASTTVSAAPSQSTIAGSSRTSITSPDEESEPPCDPVDEQSGGDGEEYEDTILEQRMEAQGQRPWPTPHGRRSYADVAAEQTARRSPDLGEQRSEAERNEFLSGMHRIVRGLAAREDIPDEWWAQAGLSRSMSWEDSSP
ncbi:hypothetical protein GGR56DRAFT_583367 [Xylariaceae sp. FL0804]|nr:hypothetical protein GGR56DRAFT_583367 [Xylariaceae sp. FL0804]